jgi:hypothetical protein
VWTSELGSLYALAVDDSKKHGDALSFLMPIW